MHSAFTYLKLLVVCLVLLVHQGCKEKQRAAQGKGSHEVEPGDMKPQVDTRFQEKYFDALLFKANGEGLKAYTAFEECLKFDPKNGAVHFELGRLDLDFRKDVESAGDHAKQAIAADKTNPWYHLLMGKVLVGKGDYAGAAKSFALVSKLNPLDQNVLYEQAEAQINAKMLGDAIKTYDQLEKSTGIYEELTMRKHRLYLELEKWDMAGLELQKLAEYYPEMPQYWSLLAQHYQKMGNGKGAAMAMERMLANDPENGQAHFQLSEFHARNGDEKKSFEELKLAFSSSDVTIDQKIGVMIRYLTLTDTQKEALPQAMELLAILKQVNGNEAKTHSIAGDFYYRDHKVTEALASYHRALELDPDRNLIWQQVLVLDHEMQDWPGLEKDSESALELFPNEPVFYYYKALYCQHQKLHAEAIESFRIGKDMVIDNDALMVRFLAGLGDEYFRSNDYKKSDESFDEALRLQPNEVYVLNNYAYFLGLRKERLEQAEQMARYANELVPNEASYQDTYAWVLYTRGKYTEALTWIERASLADPSSAELEEHFGDILFKLNRKDEAMMKWKRAKELGGVGEKLSQKISSGQLIE